MDGMYLCDNLGPLGEADGREGFDEHGEVFLPAVLEQDALLDGRQDELGGGLRFRNNLNKNTETWSVEQQYKQRHKKSKNWQ